MTIRQARKSDADEVVQLILLAIKDIANQLTGENEPEKVFNQLKSFYLTEGNRFSYPLIQVKESNQKVVGMILCYNGQEAAQLYEPIKHHLATAKQIPSPVIDDEADLDEYYIDALAVHPTQQGKGIAKLLFQAAEHYAHVLQLKKIALNVDQENQKALELYTRLGYKADKELYINKRPYFHMIKRLS